MQVGQGLVAEYESLRHRRPWPRSRQSTELRLGLEKSVHDAVRQDTGAPREIRTPDLLLRRLARTRARPSLQAVWTRSRDGSATHLLRQQPPCRQQFWQQLVDSPKRGPSARTTAGPERVATRTPGLLRQDHPPPPTGSNRPTQPPLRLRGCASNRGEYTRASALALLLRRSCPGQRAAGRLIRFAPNGRFRLTAAPAVRLRSRGHGTR